jgi:CelD/BcsL family acetyltransferase involved in cellulose biosynthesis
VSTRSYEKPGRSSHLIVARDLDGFDAAWDRLVDAAPVPSPFLRSWWLTSVAGAQPRFLLVLDGDGLVGGLALEEVRRFGIRRWLPIGNTMGADHLDLVVVPGREGEVTAALQRWFLDHAPYVIDFVGLAAGARVLRAVPSPAEETVFDTAPHAVLPATWAEFVQSRPRELRHLIERPRRRLARDGVEHRMAGPEQCEEALAAFRGLHAAQWGDRSEFLPSFDRFARAARAGLERNELVLHELVVGGRVIAVNVSFEVAGRLSFYQGARDNSREWRGSGTALMGLTVERACELGLHEFDLLRGPEPYKELWASESRDLITARGSGGFLGRAALSMQPLAQRVRRLTRRSRP